MSTDTRSGLTDKEKRIFTTLVRISRVILFLFTGMIVTRIYIFGWTQSLQSLLNVFLFLIIGTREPGKIIIE
jgi:hypothetical protein